MTRASLFLNRKILYFLAAVFAIGFIFITGFYPVAATGRSIIWKYELDILERAILHITNADLILHGSRPLDLRISENKTDLRRNALNFLIEDALIKYRGPDFAGDLEKRSEGRVYKALESSPDLSPEIKTLYGLSENDFYKFILLPKSRQEVMDESLRAGGRNLQEWLSGIKKKAKVIIFIPSFHWTGEGLE